MGNPRSAWGIDIGNRALKAIKLVRDSAGALKVEDFEVIEHETPLSNAGDNRDSLVQAALAQFVQRHPDRKGICGVSVSGSNSLARFIKLPPVEPKKIPDIVRFEAIQQIPFPLDDVEWSYQLFQGPESPDVEVGIFAMRKELINHHMKFFTDVGLRVEVVQLNPLAVYNAVQYDQRIDGATMIIDLGSENTDLIIADGQSIWLRSIPVGGKNFTEVLVKQFKLPFSKAEELKRTAATSKYAKQIFQAMRPVFADLVAEVQRSMGFYASVHRDSRLKRVLALGGTFQLPGLQKYLQQNLQLEVLRVDRFSAGGPSEAKQRAAFDENLLSLASAYGLAIQAMGDASINSSLLPAHIRREKMWKDKIPWFIGAAACFLAGTGVAMGSYFLQNVEYQHNQSVRDDTQQVLGEAKRLSDSWNNEVEVQGTGDRQRVANVESMLWYRDVWPGLIRDIQGSLPKPSNPVLLSNDWDKIKQIGRADRDVLAIDSITSTYDTDLSKTATVAPPPGAAPAVPGMPGAPTGAQQTSIISVPANTINPGQHGFVIVIDLVTPYKQNAVDAMTWVKNTYIKNLLALKAQEAAAGASYSMLYADVTLRQLVSENATYQAKLQMRLSNWQAAAAAAGAGGAPGAGPTAAGTLIDPNTQEDMSRDSFVEITALVAINPPGTPAPGNAAPGAIPGH
jgi:type IV pilus assembly protein PilM